MKAAKAVPRRPWPVLKGVLPLAPGEIPGDVLAGATLAALGIPEVLGYAKIAGLPVVTGLYTILLPMAVFALLGASRHLAVGADSATAAIFAAGAAGLAQTGSPRYVALAGLGAILARVLLLGARLARLGFLANFLSRTALVGFLTGVGIQVAAGQIGAMLGVGGSGQGALGKLAEAVRGAPHTCPATLAVSASNLHARLALAGPDDEIKELGSTFDGLPGRLEAAFEAQRRFVANASHELRTPLARQRTLLEVALGDPDATIDSLRASYARVLAAVEQQERLIEALLTLARSERGLERREPVDLAVVTDEVLLTRRPEVQRRGLHVDAALSRAPTMGDPHLVERLVANLVDNAVRHNEAAGRITVVTETRAGHAVLAVANGGPVIPAAAVERLFQPFQRLGAERTAQRDGLGLGLSIVQAIATAHGAALTAHAQPDGGLAIEVRFPAASAGTTGQAVPSRPELAASTDGGRGELRQEKVAVCVCKSTADQVGTRRRT